MVTVTASRIGSPSILSGALSLSKRSLGPGQWLLQQRRHAGSCSSRPLSTSAAIRKSGPWSDPITKPLNRYVILAEDYAGAGTLARRLEVRERHLEQAAKGKEVGRIEVGGGLLNRDFSDVDENIGPTSALAGSLFIVRGESVEDVRSRLAQDEYVLAGVFDPSKIRIFPFLRAMNEQSVEIGNESVGQTTPVSTRTPMGHSSARPSFDKRSEVYVANPRASGKTLNEGDRKTTESTLGHLRSGGKKEAATLDSLRSGSFKGAAK